MPLSEPAAREGESTLPITGFADDASSKTGGQFVPRAFARQQDPRHAAPDRSSPNRFPHRVSLREEALSVPGFPFRCSLNRFGSREHGSRARTNRSRAPRYFGHSPAVLPDPTGAGNDGAAYAGPLQQ